MIEHVVDALAVARLTRLVTRDKITEDARGAAVLVAYQRRDGYRRSHDDLTLREWATVPLQDAQAPRLAQLVTCSWCVSIYVALGVAIARRRWPRAWAPVADALAFSAVAGYGQALERD